MPQPGASALPGPSFGRHLSRAVDWNVREIEVTPRERARLAAVGVHEPRLQALLSWRRSSLMVALPVLVLTRFVKMTALEE